MTKTIPELAQEYSRLWDECVEADNATYEEDCYGDLPKDRGPHVIGRSEKGLAANAFYKQKMEEKAEVATALKRKIQQQAGIDTWKLRCLFI